MSRKATSIWSDVFHRNTDELIPSTRIATLRAKRTSWMISLVYTKHSFLGSSFIISAIHRVITRRNAFGRLYTYRLQFAQCILHRLQKSSSPHCPRVITIAIVVWWIIIVLKSEAWKIASVRVRKPMRERLHMSTLCTMRKKGVKRIPYASPKGKRS